MHNLEQLIAEWRKITMAAPGLPPETLDEERRELIPEVRIQAFELKRLLHPLGLAEPVEGGVAGLGLASGVLGEREAGEDLEVQGRVLERGESRDAEVAGRFREAPGPVGRLALPKRRRPGVLLSPRGGYQDEDRRHRGRRSREAGHAAMLSRGDGGFGASSREKSVRPNPGSSGALKANQAVRADF